ncbi:hypothetical protein [uncultured Rhodoblastus sp.]|uniref:hypothetical protein n=1 Tax=uncultured Rhodoblastus sp. TaxID=543037 RepID=UPI0025F305A6|nr:hypothetical protein [uncultured Rhodoblastus sp.]
MLLSFIINMLAGFSGSQKPFTISGVKKPPDKAPINNLRDAYKAPAFRMAERHEVQLPTQHSLESRAGHLDQR